MPRALVSVTDKTGVEYFARGLVERGFEIISTGGTAKALRQAGIEVLEVADVTGFPEMLDGRVKTLHPMVHGGLLGDTRLESHRRQMEEACIRPIKIAAVNLYAFEQTVQGGPTLAEAVESIDIGGPAMVRAAAKNFGSVTVVVDPSDYATVLQAIDEGNLESHSLRLSAKAFRHTAYYDSMVSRYLTAQAGETGLPETWTVGFKKKADLRYGENSHQTASVYTDPLALPGIAQAAQLWGKELSYNNYLDSDSAWELVADLPPTSCAVIKHGNPCGASQAGSFAEAYKSARQSDPVSAFGGIAAFNGPIDLAAAEAMTEKGNFLEVVIATGFEPEALEVFQNRSGWGQDVRLLVATLPSDEPTLSARAVRGGVLVQTSDEEPPAEWSFPTKRMPTPDELEAMKMAWRIVKHVKSNAIVLADATRLVGVGAGQMNRVQSVRLALDQAGALAPSCALASDAFFPFPDSIETAAAAGVVAVVQPGGSKKDPEVVAAADSLGVAMAMTSVRHFRH